MPEAVMHKQAKIFVAGATGMVGSAIVRKLLSKGYDNLVGSYHTRAPAEELYVYAGMNREDLAQSLAFVPVDLTDQSAVNHFFNFVRPRYVIIAAARVGGIYANSSYPAQFIYENTAIQANVIHAAHHIEVERLLFLGSSCIYPKGAPQPMRERDLLTGILEPTNEPYAIAKIAGIKMCESYNRQYGTRYLAAMPTNLYGPNDNFDLETSHVLPALIRKFHIAKQQAATEVVIWGSGDPRREFMHVDDMADACIYIMNLDNEVLADTFLNYPEPCFVNVGIGQDCTIRELAATIREIVGHSCDLVFDTTKPDGAAKKLLDVSRLSRLGWKASLSLRDGIKQTYQWYQQTLSIHHPSV